MFLCASAIEFLIFCVSDKLRMRPELHFGEPLGTVHGVTAFSNLDDSFFSGEKHFICGVYTGYKYQCVEFARRYLLVTRGCQFDQCFRAAEIFHMTSVTNVETGEVYPLTQNVNGHSTSRPQAGDIFVYPNDQELMPVGHVAIIAEVGDDWVGIAEQNQESYSWNGKSYGRRLPLRCDPASGAWTIEETDPENLQPSGWLSCDTAPRRPDPHSPLKPLEQYMPSDEPCSFLKRRVVAIDDTEALQRKAKGWPLPYFPPAETETEKAFVEYLQRCHPKWLSSMKSVIYPNESSGVGCIGSFNATFRAVTHGLDLLLNSRVLLPAHADFAEWVSSRYNFPKELVLLLGDQVHSTNQAHNCLAITATLGFVGGAVRVLDSNFDSLANLAEAACFQSRVCNENGHDEGWTPSITRDVKRFVEKVLTRHDKTDTLYFLDLGASDEQKYSFISEAEKYQYDRDRHNGLVLLDFVKKARDDAGCIVTPHDLAFDESGRLMLRGSDKEVRVVHKLCSWGVLFKMCTLDEHLAAICIAAQRDGHVRFYPPLYVHATSSPNFVKDLHDAFAVRDESLLSEAQVELKDFLPPLEVDETKISTFTSDGCSPFSVSVRAVSIGGYWSTGVFLERRAGSAVWRPACYRFMMHKREFTREEIPEENDD